MLVWDPVSERNLPFGTLKTAALGASPRSRFHYYTALTTLQTSRRKSTTRAHAVRPPPSLFPTPANPSA